MSRVINHADMEHSGEDSETEMDLEAILTKLAELTPIEYDKVRESHAKTLGIRVSVLDKEVVQRRGTAIDDHSIVEELEPWHEPVSIHEILEELRATLERHVILPTGAAVAIPLWIAGAYAYEPLRTFPKLLITSPEKRCGKTTLLEAIQALAPKALLASSITPAVIFRVVEKYKPTLMIDEADTFVAGNDEIRGIINSGHTRSSASVIRCEGDNHEPRKYSTWAPMVLASIKLVGDTITDRSIVIQLRRKTRGETAEKLSPDLFLEAQHLRRKLLRWAKENSHKLKSWRPVLPDSGNDRALDNWTPLLGVAEIAGGSWPEEGRIAFISLTDSDDDSEAIGPLLLADIKTVFDERGVESIWSGDLVDALTEMEERPWCEWKRGHPMTANSLSKLLQSFGIRSKQMKQGGLNRRGYRRSDFEDSFKRYI